MAIQLTITGNHLRRGGITLLVVLVAIGAIALLAWVLSPEDPFGGGVNSKRYQAIRVADGTTFFGHVSVANEDMYRVKDVYLIQPSAATKGKQPNAQVVPLTSQLYQPESSMLVPRRQVIWVQNLQGNSRVVKAIKQVGGK